MSIRHFEGKGGGWRREGKETGRGEKRRHVTHLPLEPPPIVDLPLELREQRRQRGLQRGLEGYL
jgi:hypothetical protein